MANGKVTDMKWLDEDNAQRFRSLPEFSVAAIVIMEGGIIIDADQALNRIFGYEDEDPRGKPATDFIAPDLRAFTNERIRAGIEGAYETFGLRKGGSIFPIEVNAREFKLYRRTLRVSAVRDLTDHKEMERQLKDYHRRFKGLENEWTQEPRLNGESFRNVFGSAADGIYQTTREGRFLIVNPAFAEICGYESPEEFLRSHANMSGEIYADPGLRKKFTDTVRREGMTRGFELRFRRKDGTIKYVSLDARGIRDGGGKILYLEGTAQDIDEKKSLTVLLTLQRDLALKLSRAVDLEECAGLIVQTAVTVSGMECGGISLKNKGTGGFDLVHSINLSDSFRKEIQHITVGSFTWSRIMEGRSFHVRPSRDLTPIAFQEGFQFISLMPMLQRGEVVGLLATASRERTEIPVQVRMGLEILAAGSASIVTRIQIVERLRNEIITREQAERTLEIERQNLQEANTALKVLLRQRDEDRKDLEASLLANVQQLVMPYVQKLKTSAVDPDQQMTVDLIVSNLNDLIAPFLRSIQGFNFTPRQLELVILIKQGRTTKEIARVLNMTKQAVDIQRYLIRKKLGLNRTKTNLQVYLKSFQY